MFLCGNHELGRCPTPSTRNAAVTQQHHTGRSSRGHGGVRPRDSSSAGGASSCTAQHQSVLGPAGGLASALLRRSHAPRQPVLARAEGRPDAPGGGKMLGRPSSFRVRRTAVQVVRSGRDRDTDQVHCGVHPAMLIPDPVTCTHVTRTAPPLAWHAYARAPAKVQRLHAIAMVCRLECMARAATHSPLPLHTQVTLLQPEELREGETCDKLLVYCPGTDGTGQAILPQVPGLRSLGFDVWCGPRALSVCAHTLGAWGRACACVRMCLCGGGGASARKPAVWPRRVQPHRPDECK